jgi:hypothetical protein
MHDIVENSLPELGSRFSPKFRGGERTYGTFRHGVVTRANGALERFCKVLVVAQRSQYSKVGGRI